MKRFLFLLFSFAVAMMSWEGQLTAANLVDQGPIPQKSIRLRIIANSDSFQDQWLKREVRDAIINQMNAWVNDLKDYEDAVTMVAAKLPDMQKLVDKTIQERGFRYSAAVDFGQVPFPTKMYGSYVYPVGEYQALRVRIGEAKGENWWCVLFPPLCFIDMSNGDAVAPATTNNEREPSNEDEPDDDAFSLQGWLTTDNFSESVDEPVENHQTTVATHSAPKPELRFYLIDRLAAWF